MIANLTPEMRRENYQMRQEFSYQLQTELQKIVQEMEVVRYSTDTGLTNCVKNFESECDKINENINDYKLQTDASMNSFRSVEYQNREELKNEMGKLTHEVRSVAFGIEKCNSSIQITNWKSRD